MAETNFNKRVTIRDIAEAVGLHFTTVSEALRDSPRIKQSTRDRVQAMAKKMGYRRDPMLSALMTYRTQSQKRKFQGVLAWINCFSDERMFTNDQGAYAEYLQGAKQRSEEQGYKLEEFWFREKGMTVKRAESIFKARNIQGLIIPPVPDDCNRLDFNWNKFTVVRFGYTLDQVRLPRVTAHQFRNACMLYDKLLSLGYERIGLACLEFADNRVGRQFSGGFLSMNTRRKNQRDCIPAHLAAGTDEKAKAAFIKWVRKYRPEVIMGSTLSFFCEALREADYRIPDDIAIGALSREVGDNTFAGIYENSIEIGIIAVDVLLSLSHLNHRGLTNFSRTTSVTGVWMDGASAGNRVR